MPSGYTKKRRVGTVRNDASSNFKPFVQEGNFVFYESTYGILSAGQSLVYATVDASANIPPTSGVGYFSMHMYGTHATPGTSMVARILKTGVNTGGTGGGSGILTGSYAVASQTNQVNEYARCPVDGSQQVDYVVDFLPASGGLYLSVKGYFDRI